MIYDSGKKKKIIKYKTVLSELFLSIVFSHCKAIKKYSEFIFEKTDI